MLKQTLQADGILCDTAPTNRDALSTLFTPTSPPPVNNSKFPYDIVLIDVSSPSSEVWANLLKLLALNLCRM